MNDIVPEKEPVPTNIVAKHGVTAIGQIAGGILFLIMHIFSARLPPLGIVFGLLGGGIGLSGMLSKDPADKKPGVILFIAGVLKLIFHVGPPVIRPFAGSLLTIASLILLALGIFNGIKFLKGLNSRK
ncbi:MAG: hypothetical protein FWF22_05555 [Treponema sp.]|nr:hypothetical protein [Treponema sp.]